MALALSTLETPAIIEPLVKRHASDAAFYWAQHDSSAHSPQIDFSRLLHFNRLLQAHLDGLTVAGEAGWRFAFEELGRWKGASETFVAAYLALTAQESDKLRQVWLIVEASSDRALRGLISALGWVDPALSRPWIGHWLGADHNPALQVTALRAAALGDEDTVELARPFLEKLLASPAPQVRAAAMRLAGRVESAATHPFLDAGLKDADPVVCGEAAIALGWLAPAESAPVLWRSCAEWIVRLPELKGWERFQSDRRLGRWLRHLGALLPPGHVAVPKLLSQLPPRLGLLLALHHADPAHLPWVVAQMEAKADARFAGWVWSMLVGLALDEAGLALPADIENDDELSLVSSDQDAGLPVPDPAAVKAWMALHFAALPQGQTCLFGRPVSDETTREMLFDGAQTLRWMAAQRLSQPFFNVRAPAWRQYAFLNRLAQD